MFAALLIAALVLLIVVQAVGRHRRLARREAEGQASIPTTTWVVFGAAAVFLLFAVFGLPAILHR